MDWMRDPPPYEADYNYILPDDPPDEAIDSLLQTAMELGGVLTPDPAFDERAFRALGEIGVQAEAIPPPAFHDAETGTSYWIGVFQPDKDDREHCVTSILSLGDGTAHLAPCVPGDWDKAYAAAEYLIGIAGRGDMGRVFDAAEGMALATDQRELWQTERGVPLETEAARDIADQWDVTL